MIDNGKLCQVLPYLNLKFIFFNTSLNISVLASMLQKFSYWTFCVQCFQVPNMKFEFQIIHRKFTTSCSNEDCRFACSLILVMCIYVWYWPLSPLFTIESAAWQNQVVSFRCPILVTLLGIVRQFVLVERRSKSTL